MRHLRFAAVAVALFAVAGTALAGAATGSVAAPKNLRAFLLRVDEPVSHSFPRTPAFAWSPVPGARCYQFELGTSRRFTENSLIWSNVPFVSGAHSGCPTVPAISIDTALPWFTGSPYGLFAHVRAVTSNGTSQWSAPFGFNVRWTNIPKPMSTQPGLVRWTPVEGATRYQVWYQDTGTPLITTNTNVADEREYYTFHTDPSWTATVHWRVRAVRQLFGQIPNGLPAVTYGPWSPVYTSTNPPVSTNALALHAAISDKVTMGKQQAAHELMPGLTWNGSSIGGRQYSLFRPYAFTDADCVNVVYTGAVVGSPAYAPRLSGPLKLPTSDTDLQLALNEFLPSAASESNTFAADGSRVMTNEAVQDGSSGSGSTSTESTSSTSSSSASSSSSVSGTGAIASPKVDLPDLNFPTTRYFWTLVPVLLTMDDSGAIKYVDAEVPQDACSAQRRASFGKESAPVTTASGTPFVAGLSPKGRLLSSVSHQPMVYGTPLVAWQPAKAAASYQVQWSRKLYPWSPAGSKVTSATSTMLNLAPGRWYYRVRGLNPGALRIPFMSWSNPVQISVARPTFRIVGGGAQITTGDSGGSGGSGGSSGSAAPSSAFSVRLPAGWTRAAGFSGSGTYARYVRDGVQVGVLDVRTTTMYSSDPATFLRQASAEWKAIGVKGLATGFVNLPGGRALRATFTLNVGNAVVRELQYAFLPRSGRTWILTFGAPDLLFGTRLGEFESMARSFRAS